MRSDHLNKQTLIDAIVHKLNAQLQQAMDAAQQALDGATHEQSKAETQYDTLGLEHAYLAEGQSRRIEQLQHAIARLQSWQVPAFEMDDEIYLGALVHLRYDQQFKLIFLCPEAGGEVIQTLDSSIQIVTPQSPLGQSLLGLGIEDQVSLQNQRYTITQLS